MLASFQCSIPLHHLFEVDHLLEWKLHIVTLLQIKEFVKLFTIIIANKPILQVCEKFGMRSVNHDGWYEESSGHKECFHDGSMNKVDVCMNRNKSKLPASKQNMGSCKEKSNIFDITS